MQGASSFHWLMLAMAAMLLWAGLSVLRAALRLRRSYELVPNRFLYPANCPPELCRDPAGFVAFICPRQLAFGGGCLGLALLLTLQELTGLFAGLLAGLPGWLSNGAPLLLFVPLFVWYTVFINKAAKRFW